MEVAIIKYNAGNVQSVIYALRRLGVEPIYTDNEETLRKVDKVIFPGVGEASSTMTYLKAKGLDKVIPSLTQPVLGTCVGMQLMCRYSEENDTECLGIFDIDVKRFPPVNGIKVPQTGWNDIYQFQNPLCTGLKEHSYVYYNHSYYAPLCEYTVAKTDYGVEYSAMLHKDNFYAAQFHAEISSKVGASILENFLKL
ncbi:imidazole glycerol phosphate synthase subunit HisH [Xanthocytophaga agilis]|uniref:Imidazole glycerol phosphate synthase subunit HisH n=1 Tax=Xanthocytophaga agilis TaxID=3048010 RepID=A0AAE3QZX2_9BACT|nr:imidazole glycerol phosphate synthase subunit HisH [Xanthocytophaga agilis]MDJ1500570.1 imidazole glycerol phosphate synthase subunit HisH [Xanthocytophaga agilis]